MLLMEVHLDERLPIVMKGISKLAAFLCLSVLSTAAFAQGTVSFANGPTTLISYDGGPWPAGFYSPIPPNDAGGFYFGLLIAGSATGPFNFTGIYATNTTGAGKLGPGTYTPAVPGWATGTTMFFEVAGWSSNLGFTWHNGWLVNNVPAPPGSAVWGGNGNGYFGLSNVGSGAPGGGVAPPLPIFGGNGVGGFALFPFANIPEPNEMVLLGLGVTCVLIFRRRK
jgi:hypothetical protein